MRSRSAAIVGAVAFAAAALALAVRPSAPPPDRGVASSAVPIPAQYDDPTFFASAIAQAKGPIATEVVTGITVPHHLLAKDLIADAFRFASGRAPRQVLVMSPDHFALGATDVSVAARDLATPFGVLKTDGVAVAALLRLPAVRAADFYYREHGIEAELPFIKRSSPDARVIALTFKETADRDELDAVVAALEGVLDRDALVVQSTDFSHYLPAKVAAARDDETVAAILSGDPAAAFRLTQPDHLDSAAAQYVQMRLQKGFFGSTVRILARRNSQDYATAPLDSTTSYVVQAYVRPR